MSSIVARSTDEGRRRAVADRIGERAPALERAQGDTDWEVRVYAAEALKRLKPG